VEKCGYSHFLYLEEDVRVRNTPDGGTGLTGLKWDEIIVGEFFRQPRHLIMGGNVMIYNIANLNRQLLQRYERFLEETKANGRWLPIPPYGWKPATNSEGACVFCNGAGTVFSCAGLNLLFPERKAGMSDLRLAASCRAWDFSAGMRLSAKFPGDEFDLVGYLPSVCSQYGNVLSRVEEREQWLAEGRSVLIHQQKVK
jgi:hypothetical protein